MIAKEQKKLFEQQVNVLNDRILNYRNIITNLNEKDSATIEGYELELKTMREERLIFEDQVKSLEKLLKKEKRKRKWTAAGGLALTGIATYLYIVK